MKKLVAGILIMCALLTMASDAPNDKSSDEYVRDRVVMLLGNQRQCSGVEINAPSGKHYILTAAHCSALLEYEQVMAIDEAGDSDYVHFVAIDAAHDLMLLSNLDEVGLNVAERAKPHEKVHSMTHGHGWPSYRTDGELLAERTIEVNMGYITSQEEADKCSSLPWQRVEDEGLFAVCLTKLTLMGTTAFIVPGSSGGPVLNADGELVGIVSAGDGIFGYLVPLHSIRHFLKDK